MKLINPDETVLAVIDVQGKLADTVFQRDRLLSNLKVLIQGFRILDIPILWTEHVPEKLGSTIEALQSELEGLAPIWKNTFSCAREEKFSQGLRTLKRNTVVLSGIETHVCVYQTAIDLLDQGLRVEVVADAVSSRTPENRKVGLNRMLAAGASGTSVEMLLFELQKIAGGDTFRRLIRLIK